ncbi:hypothetical protein [Arthrobacter sp. BE255]|uniref:hypothetical protein n=1 Tax=Arthrobacter sp. BE255 TaxID=2817721 RepID=UPI00285E5BAE|nr:hypothetical protein [Arthrobacter sp. BE255]MDR7157373.1 hypothetical protein [Arthrobacter sp. BE255]
MNLSRRLLFASAFWEVARPRTALNAGHLLIRLTNPAVAFDLRSAADWLLCHNAARQALADVLGAQRCTVVFAHQWHPIGAAIGEPEAESSTPTFHVFGRWDGEPVTPGEQLRLPAQRRVPAPGDRLLEYDGGLRAALRRSALERQGEAGRQSAEPVPVGDAVPELVAAAPRFKAGAHHTVLAPASGEPGLTPGHLLALAGSLQGLTERRGVTGLSCVVPEPGSGLLEVHALGRSAGESVNPMQEFLDLPEVSQALL